MRDRSRSASTARSAPSRCARISPSSARVADTLVCAYPNAGLPNEFGHYDESPDDMAALLGEFAAAGLVNIVGGCCGTTPDHIRAIAAAVAGKTPRAVPAVAPLLRLSGLEPFTLTPEIPFVNVGERTNVTGSARFRKLITAGDYAAALAVARDQVENGAQIIDVNMDEGLLDSEKAMTDVPQPDRRRARHRARAGDDRFLEIRGDRGRAEMRAGQGGRELDLAEGGRGGVHRATPRPVRRYGAAVVVMAFDEKGQADTLERKTAICGARLRHPGQPASAFRRRTSSSIRTSSPSPPAWRSTTATASLSSRRARWIRQNLPHAHVSGGVSNLSFSFRGNELVREAMHSVFLYHAIAAGMDHGHRQRRPDRGLRRSRSANCARPAKTWCSTAAPTRPSGCWRSPQRHRGARQGKEGGRPVLARMAGREAPGACAGARHHRFHRRPTSRKRGATRHAPARRDRGPADGRHEHGRRPVRLGPDVPAAGGEVGAGDEAGGRLSAAFHGAGQGRPRARRRSNGKIVLGDRQRRRARHRQEHRRRRARNATTTTWSISASWCRRRRSCEAATAEQADIIGLSGLITPSLDEMCHVAAEMERQGFDVPLLIGGATTSRVHTAVKIHPELPARADGLRQRREPRRGRRLSLLLGARRASAFVTETARRIRPHRRRACARRSDEAAPVACRRARQCAASSTGPATTCRRRRHLSAPIGSPTFRSPNSSATSTGPRSSPPGSSTANFPRSSTTPKVGEAARSLFADAQEMLRTDRRRTLVHGRAR